MNYNIEYLAIPVQVKPDESNDIEEGFLLILEITKLDDDNIILEFENE